MTLVPWVTLAGCVPRLDFSVELGEPLVVTPTLPTWKSTPCWRDEGNRKEILQEFCRLGRDQGIRIRQGKGLRHSLHLP